jgi:hypothetical protein
MNIIDRKEEIEAIRDHIRQGKSLHIHGFEGVGKSALIDYVYCNWEEIGTLRIPIYCKNSCTLEQILDTLAKFLLALGKKLVDIDYERKTEKLILHPDELPTVPRRYLRNMVFPHIKRGEFCIILDHLENVSQRTNSFLKTLYVSTSVISAGRESWDKTKIDVPGMLQYALWDIPKLEVKNLDKESAFSLMINLLYNSTTTKAAASRRLFEEVYAATQGNPKMIKKYLPRLWTKKSSPQHAEIAGSHEFVEYVGIAYGYSGRS